MPGSYFSVLTSQTVEIFTWDHRNRLTSVKTLSANPGAATTATKYLASDSSVRMLVETVSGQFKASPVISYAYDVFDQIITRSLAIDGAGTNTSYFAYDRGNRVLTLQNVSGTITPTKRTLWNPQAVDEVLANEELGTTYWMLTDEQETVRNVVYKAGSHHVERVTYDVFGDPDLSTATLSTRPGLYHIDQFFHGRTLDWTTGLYYDGDRWYDPVAQRFISENDGGYDAGNLYLYRNNNPNVAQDTPSGLFDTFPAFRDWLSGRSDTELFLGTALVAVPLGIAAGPSVAAAVPTTYATGTVLAGGAAGGIAGAMQAQAGVSNASWSDYTIGAGLGGVFGMISPIGGFADLGGTIVGGALDCRFGSGDFYGQGMVWGGLAAGIIGGGIEQGVYAGLAGKGIASRSLFLDELRVGVGLEWEILANPQMGVIYRPGIGFGPNIFRGFRNARALRTLVTGAEDILKAELQAAKALPNAVDLLADPAAVGRYVGRQAEQQIVDLAQRLGLRAKSQLVQSLPEKFNLLNKRVIADVGLLDHRIALELTLEDIFENVALMSASKQTQIPGYILAGYRPIIINPY